MPIEFSHRVYYQGKDNERHRIDEVRLKQGYTGSVDLGLYAPIDQTATFFDLNKEIKPSADGSEFDFNGLSAGIKFLEEKNNGPDGPIGLPGAGFGLKLLTPKHPVYEYAILSGILLGDSMVDHYNSEHKAIYKERLVIRYHGQVRGGNRELINIGNMGIVHDVGRGPLNMGNLLQGSVELSCEASS